jgi:hypothetical protein
VAWASPDGDSYGINAAAFCLVGDANTDGIVDVLDVFFLITRLFAGGSVGLGCSDANLDGTVDVLDVFWLITYLFAAGPAPL